MVCNILNSNVKKCIVKVKLDAESCETGKTEKEMLSFLSNNVEHIHGISWEF